MYDIAAHDTADAPGTWTGAALLGSLRRPFFGFGNSAILLTDDLVMFLQQGVVDLTSLCEVLLALFTSLFGLIEGIFGRLEGVLCCFEPLLAVSNIFLDLLRLR